jgi:hypothetical protein
MKKETKPDTRPRLDVIGFRIDHDYFQIETMEAVVRGNDMSDLMCKWHDYYVQTYTPERRIISLERCPAKRT